MPNRKGVKSTTKTAHTSPGNIALQRRRAQALEMRERGQSFKTIAQELKCAAGTAFNYVSQAIKDLIPQETVQQELALERQRYNALLARWYPKALELDAEATRICLKIQAQYERLVGLIQPAGITVNNNTAVISDAEKYGIRVIGVPPSPSRFTKEDLADPATQLALPKPDAKTIDHDPGPLPELKLTTIQVSDADRPPPEPVRRAEWPRGTPIGKNPFKRRKFTAKEAAERTAEYNKKYYLG